MSKRKMGKCMEFALQVGFRFCIESSLLACGLHVIPCLNRILPIEIWEWMLVEYMVTFSEYY